MIIHHGYRASAGHYYAIIKVKTGDDSCKWVKFDDDKITFIDEQEIHTYSQKAYLLFYQKTWVYPPQPARRKKRQPIRKFEVPFSMQRAKTMLER